MLLRETFTTSRLAEFCSQRELVAQTGHPVDDWPLVIVKELRRDPTLPWDIALANVLDDEDER